jgi:hypothetical protein
MVGDYPGNRNAWLETGMAVDQGGDAARAAMCIRHQQDRSGQPLRNLRRAALQRALVGAIEQAHHAFDHRNVCIVRSAAEKLAHVRLAAHPTVQVVTGPTGRQLQISGVEIVGTHFEGLYPQAATPQEQNQSECQRGLPYPALGSRDNNSGNPYLGGSLWIARRLGNTVPPHKQSIAPGKILRVDIPVHARPSSR